MRRSPLFAGALVFFFVVIRAAAPAVAGVSFGEVAKLNPSNAGTNHKFGNAVAIDGDTMVVGAFTGEGSAALTGAAYVFSRNQGGADNWDEVVKLTASDADVYHYFGHSVAIDGDTIVVGAVSAPGIVANAGAAYVFQRNHGGPDNWGEVAKIVASDGVASDYFGHSVAISDGIVVVGARYHTAAASQSGAAYVFERNLGGADSWGERAKLTASDAASQNAFGHAVAIDGDTVVIGANQDKSVYVFDRNRGGADSWGEVKILSGSSVGGLSFGVSVDLSGDLIAVGGYNGSDIGATWVFERNLGGPDNWGEVARVAASDGSPADTFGISVSISHDRLLVGASRNDTTATDAGAAYLFARNAGGADSWGHVQRIEASDIADSDFFGYAVALDRLTAVIGATQDDDFGSYSGSVYVFAGCGGSSVEWTETAKTVASDGFADHQYAKDVAFDGDIAVVGAKYDDDLGSAAGAAYVLMRNLGGPDNWGELKKIYASDGYPDQYFGQRVAMSRDVVVIGTYQDDEIGDNSGAVYVYERNHGGADNWGQVAKLTASDGVAGAWFGYSVAFDGDTIVVGAVYDTGGIGTNAGAAYVFARNHGGANTWGEVTKLTASDGWSWDMFGFAVAISGDTIAVGAGRETTGSAIESGAAYVFARNQGGADNWGEIAKLKASDAATNDYFGTALDLSNDTLLVGSSSDDDAGFSSGSAYVFERNHGGQDSWGEVAKLTASDAAAYDLFASADAVAIDGDVIVIGCYKHELFGIASGSFYVYERNNGGADAWGETAVIVPSDQSYAQNFGNAVDLVDGTVMVGAVYDATMGSVYFFNAGCPEFDYGDAPDPDFPTLAVSGGARHKLGGNVYLGATVDMDLDGQPTANADGDDTDAGGDDDDGVTFSSLVMTGASADVEVVASDACLLNAWVDFNDDGDWDDAGEQIFSDEALVTGTNPLTFSVPPDHLPGADVVARFRVSSAGGVGPGGEAADGEVEDHVVHIEAVDFGDAPDPTYPTLLASDGARHLLGGSLYLGSLVDAEPDGLPSSGSNGDDLDNLDDEDGFTLGMLPIGGPASGTITATEAGLVDGWIDFNLDGDWDDAGEQIFASYAVTAGSNSFSIPVPATAVAGHTVARVRISSTGGLSPTGLAPDGEVEDYAIEIVEGPDLEIGMAPSAPWVPSGDALSYTVTVTNNGPLTATSVTLTDVLPAELNFVSSTPGSPDCTFAGDTLTCDLGTMAALDSAQVTIETVVVHPSWGSFSNTASVAAAELDPISANNAATVDTRIALFVDGWENGDLSAWD
ncbi:MAG: GEVED domain-containing protein [Thermoanaerobaculales bacterium]|jgi:uncharacterized repeat protein (TIGR01451 family)|nr:GEVED domain-containing protein [Thermoanaerobaculales bacterium]